jgi:hypothetical protein
MPLDVPGFAQPPSTAFHSSRHVTPKDADVHSIDELRATRRAAKTRGGGAAPVIKLIWLLAAGGALLIYRGRRAASLEPAVYFGASCWLQRHRFIAF